MAALLSLSPATVETHRARILRKLDVHNIAEVVLYAVGAAASFLDRPGDITPTSGACIAGSESIRAGQFPLRQYSATL